MSGLRPRRGSLEDLVPGHDEISSRVSGLHPEMISRIGCETAEGLGVRRHQAGVQRRRASIVCGGSKGNPRIRRFVRRPGDGRRSTGGPGCRRAGYDWRSDIGCRVQDVDETILL